MTVSVLIPQYGRTGFTSRAVVAVRRSLTDRELEVRVHDNASPGGPGPVADRDDVTMSSSSTNVGFGPAMNRMAELASGEFLLLLNNDTVVHPSAIQRLVTTASEDPASGPVVPMYRDFRGRSLEVGGGLGEGGGAWQLFHHREPPTGIRTTPHRADYGSAAAMLIRRELFLDAGGFDSLFAPAYYEDTDLCLRLADQGRPTIVEPRALVFHFEGGTAGTDLDSGLKRHQATNKAAFVARWQNTLSSHGPVGLHRSIISATAPREGQPRVLWIGPRLPRGDRDGGGRRCMEMLAGLREVGAGVAFHARTCPDPDRYGAKLTELGIPWFGGSGASRWSRGRRPQTRFDDLEELLAAADWDAVVTFSARFARRVEGQVRQHAPQAAFLIDNGDLHYLRHERGRELGVVIRDTLTKEEELDAYAAADGVLTSSRPEDDILRQEFHSLQTHVYTVAPPMPVEHPPATEGCLMFLGNLAHPPNSDAVQHWSQNLAAAVRRAAGRPIPLRVVGAGTSALGPDETIDVAGWVPDLGVEFARSRVFLAPLRYGAGTKGKLVEAMAHGVPVVTTSVGAEGFPARVRDALIITDDVEAMADAVTTLMQDQEAWERQRDEVAEAARWFHTAHARSGAVLSSWIMARSLDRRRGSVEPSRRRRAAPIVKQPAPAWVAKQTDPDRPFDASAVRGVPATAEAPVFVVGAPRSGTSMMAHALGQHSDLWTGEESDFLGPLLRDARAAWDMGRTRGDLHWLSAEGVSWEEFAAWLGLGMNAMYTSRSGGRRWVEQTPQYTLAMGHLAAMFPTARFVYLLRDGRSVAHSLRHFVRSVEHERAARLWARFVRAGLAFAESEAGDRMRILRYESVVEDTSTQMRSIQEFLELPEQPGPSSFIRDRDPINSSFATRGDARDRLPGWSEWSLEERRVFHAVAGDLLVELGFEDDASWITRDGPYAEGT